jgi:hypothetical protein
MKELSQTINKGFCINREYHPLSKIPDGSFKTIPNSLRQLPAQNLIIHEASSWSAVLEQKGIFVF